MTPLSKLLLIAAIASFSAAAHAAALPLAASPGPQMGYGQGSYGPGQTVTCTSDDGDRHYCNIDTRRGVQLTRQISGSPCIQGQTWGYDNRGLWVDRGCRAEFSVGGYGGNQWQQGQTITCSSDNGKRNFCTTPSGLDLRNVRLSRQISGSPCTRNYSWGIDRRRGLWTDRGCRAEFTVGSNGGGQWQQPQTVTCSSDNGKRNYCSTNGLNPYGATLTRQISGSPCVQNVTWGVDNSGLWTDRGCRAEFAIGQALPPQTVTCSSDNGRRNWCTTSNINPNSIVMTRQISGSPCIQNQTWGVDNRGLWVDQGCRAEFQVNTNYR